MADFDEDTGHFISIHALREEGDRIVQDKGAAIQDFNPRPPRGERLYGNKVLPIAALFQSTPSARRATPSTTCWPCSRYYFNPRPPRGGRHPAGLILYRRNGFQSTPSARRATEEGDPIRCSMSSRIVISIHALREEGDHFKITLAASWIYFNPRPPRGGRLKMPVADLVPYEFQSTPSARRATCMTFRRSTGCANFNPRPPRGGRLFP